MIKLKTLFKYKDTQLRHIHLINSATTNDNGLCRYSVKFIFILICMVMVCLGQTTRYVDKSVGLSGAGTSWATAYKELYEALNASGIGDSILVAQGVYKPTLDNARDSTFRIKGWQRVIGGYPSGGGSRNWKAYPTTLSGDIGSIGDSLDNSFHVVKFFNEEKAYLDGFIIEGGYANGGTDWDFGGGIYMNTSYKPDTVINCIIRNNYAKKRGGGLFVKNMKALIKNCRIYNNHSDSLGGGLMFENDSSYVVNCTFVHNMAILGGGLFALKFTAVDNFIINCTFAENEAAIGGGIFNENMGGDSPDIRNTIIWGNRASDSCNEICNMGSSNPAVRYCDIKGSGGSGSWNSTFGTDYGNNINVYPFYFDVDGDDNIIGTDDDSVKLQSGSPCYEMGMATGGIIPTNDIDGYTRGASSTIGAYQDTVSVPPRKIWDYGGGDNDWNTSGNWFPDGKPNYDDSVVFDGNVSNVSCQLITTDTIASIRFVNSAGSFNFGICTLNVYDTVDFSDVGSLDPGTVGALAFISPSWQRFIPKSGVTFPTLLQNGTTGTEVMANSFKAEELIISAGTFNLANYGAVDTVTALVASGGTLEFGDAELNVIGGMNLYFISNINPDSGTLKFINTTPIDIVPSQYSHPNVIIGGSNEVALMDSCDMHLKSLTINTGATFTAAPNRDLFIKGSFQNSGTFNHNNRTVTFDTASGSHVIDAGGSSFYNLFIGAGGSEAKYTLTGPLSVDSFTLEYDTLDLGSFTHTIDKWNYGMMSIYNFNSCSLRISGTANFAGADTVYPGTAVIELFASDSQNLGIPSKEVLPSIRHSGSGKLHLLYDTLNTISFTQTAGQLELNEFNIETVNDFTITNGDSTTFIDLGLKKITVGGNASFTGLSGNLLNMSPPNTWFLNVSGSLNADYAKIGNCNASGGSQGMPTVNCIRDTGNSNWAFNDPPTNITLSDTSVNENMPTGTSIGYFSAIDPNGGDLHTFSLVTGAGSTDNDSFSISGDTLYTSVVFDYENQTTYSIRIRTTDNGVGNLTYEKVFTINIFNLNDPPTVTGSSGSIAYTENDTPTVIDNGISVTDIDNAFLFSAQVYISGNYSQSQDTLLFTNQNGITGSFNDITGSLFLTGAATLVSYETALRSITYMNSSDSPDTMTRAVTFTVNDSINTSNTFVRNISITAVNDAPVISGTGSATSYTENDPAIFIDNAIMVSDIDNSNLVSATVNISANFMQTEDSLGFTDQNGITGSFNTGTGILSLTGSASLINYQTALRSVTYANSSDSPNLTVRAITFSVNDGTTNSSTFSRNVSIIPLNDAPVATNDNYATPLNSILNISSPGILVNDIDIDGDPLTAILSSDVDTGILTLGTNGSFIYTPPTGFVGTATFSYRVNDGSLNSNIANVAISVGELNVSYAAYFETSNKLLLVFPALLSPSNIHTANKVGLFVNNNTADSISLLTPWAWSFGQTQDSVFIILDHNQAETVESWAEINIKLSLYLAANTFGNGTMYNGLIDYAAGFNVTYVDDNVPPNPVTGLTVSARDCSTAVIAWTPSTSTDAKEIKICAATDSMPTNPLMGQYSMMVNSDVTTAILAQLPAHGITLYVAAFVVDNGANWSLFSLGASGRVILPDGVAPTNNIQARITAIGDSAASVVLSLTSTNVPPEKGIYFNFNFGSVLFDTTQAMRCGFHDTTFILQGINRVGKWHAAWAPFDSAGNVANPKSDSITIKNSRPQILVNQNYSLPEDSTWIIRNCAYDVNRDTITLTLTEGPQGMEVFQNTLALKWTPANSDVGTHSVRLKAKDNAGGEDSAYFTVTVINTNDTPMVISTAFPDTSYEDSLITGQIVVYDPDRNDSLSVSLSSNVPWLTATPLNTGITDSLLRFELKGVPKDADTGLIQFSALVSDKGGLSKTQAYTIFIINTNDAPQTVLKSKKTAFGAVRYIIEGRDDNNLILSYHASMKGITNAYTNTFSNTNGIFSIYPLVDGKYVFSCYTVDLDGLQDLTPYQDTIIIRGASTQTWSDSGTWNMVSIPALSSSASPFKEAGSILHWDESKSSNGIYKYYQRSEAIAELTAGNSYWCKLKSPVIINADQKNQQTDSVIITLHKAEYGWNQIASPFPYPVTWNKPHTLWEWNADIKDYVESDGILYPWKGYWVLTDKTEQVTIRPTPQFISRGLTKRSKTCFVDESEWTFNIEMISNVNSDIDNLIGISKHAKNGYDNLDRPEPPRMGTAPYLFFAHPEWKRTVDEFASDIRHTWDTKVNIFQLGISPCSKDVTALSLSISGYQSDTPVYIFTNTQSGIVQYTAGTSITVEPSGEKQYKTLFITSDKNFLNAFPHIFKLNHPFPNPCRPRATIHYTLPYRWESNGWLNTEAYKVKMVIYDARGRVVRELIHKKQKPGHYSIKWHGKSDTGRLVASGAYFCRLVAGDFASVKKIIAVR